MPPRASDFNEYEVSLLSKRQSEYRGTAAAGKPAFREALAKHFIQKRGEAETAVLVDMFAQKIYTWYANHSPKKNNKDEEKFSFGKMFTGERVWGLKNRPNIKESLPDIDPKSKDYVSTWNRTRKNLWDAMSQEDQEPWIEMADKWTEEGPDDEVKAEMARKHALRYMLAVARIFWRQFGMPIFMYGIFQDIDESLKACCYDSSELFHKKEEPYPLFRSLDNWDVNLRKKFWEFWKVIMTPEDANVDITAAVRDATAAPVLPFVFDTYDDGTPILSKFENGSEMGLTRKQKVLRQYMSIHYQFANGRKVKSVPWSSVISSPGRFFAPGMLPPPESFTWNDPDHIRESAINNFYDHVVEKEKATYDEADGEPWRFRFSHYKTTVDGEATWLPAVYPSHLEEVQPRRRAKAPVRGPKFVTSPDDDHNSPTTPGRASERSPGGRRPGGMFQPTRKATHALNVAARATARRHAKNAKNAAKKADKKRSKKAKDMDDEEWRTDDETSEDEDHMSNFEMRNGGVGPDDDDSEEVEGGDGSGGSDDGSDDDIPLQPPARATLRQTRADGKGKGRAETSIDDTPNGRATNAPLAPCSVGASGPARFKYLRGLSDHAEYQKFVSRWKSTLETVVEVTPPEALAWLSWTYESPFLPHRIHAQEKTAQVLLAWLRVGISAGASAADVQCYVLAMGMTLRDVHTAQFCTDEDGNVQEGVPDFLVSTVLTMSKLDELLQLCNRQSAPRPRPVGKAQHGTPTGVSENGPAPPPEARALPDGAPTSGGPDAPDSVQQSERPSGRSRNVGVPSTNLPRLANVSEKDGDSSDGEPEAPAPPAKRRKADTNRTRSEGDPGASDTPEDSLERPAKRRSKRVAHHEGPDVEEAQNHADTRSKPSRRGGGVSRPQRPTHLRSSGKEIAPSTDQGTSSEHAATHKRPRSGTMSNGPELVIKTRKQRQLEEASEDGPRRTRSQGSGNRGKQGKVAK